MQARPRVQLYFFKEYNLTDSVTLSIVENGFVFLHLGAYLWNATYRGQNTSPLCFLYMKLRNLKPPNL